MKANAVIDMKTKLCLYGSAASAVLACLCAAPARHYASSAYTLWLSQEPASVQLAQSAARANHLWAGTMLSFAIVAGLLLFAGLRSRQRRTSVSMPG